MARMGYPQDSKTMLMKFERKIKDGYALLSFLVGPPSYQLLSVTARSHGSRLLLNIIKAAICPWNSTALSSHGLHKAFQMPQGAYDNTGIPKPQQLPNRDRESSLGSSHVGVSSIEVDDHASVEQLSSLR
ncbi:predicted protein [Coccidioides posadasii str. Silveira]|uniref:Predicted protein n=1 Tax=Coccidioides posadasii (strain RMSCC 757 / Silveira) TaxID=443226 RepID=E9D550_COCPS|nr:predicted protein [Coccidioides posadasii str. Silveira]